MCNVQKANENVLFREASISDSRKLIKIIKTIHKKNV